MLHLAVDPIKRKTANLLPAADESQQFMPVQLRLAFAEAGNLAQLLHRRGKKRANHVQHPVGGYEISGLALLLRLLPPPFAQLLEKLGIMMGLRIKLQHQLLPGPGSFTGGLQAGIHQRIEAGQPLLP
ncbi:hypothetical protein D3C76_1377180 [compost metagenome]